ncbi:MAG TPA: histidine--tRNA ligase [Rhodospirillaceae bacterium]|nr:histidine--tRNA ligase [Rhodospirillaceae bacterium]
MSSLQPVRGTHDLLPEDSRRHRRVEELAFEIAGRYGFGEISTPIFEFTEVFSRTLGETSDVVTKEMYSFTDRSGDGLTLRPEGTAGVARAFISGGLAQQLPLKLFYRGPMFRHERPQKGRLRQFHQIGVELLGVEGPQADIEVMALAAHILDALGLGGAATLELNSLGDGDSREAYRLALVAYLSGQRDRLSKDSLERLERNPLRVLDSKDEGDKAVVAEAPLLTDYLNDASRTFFQEVLDGLAALGVAHRVNPRLVRGLDYYCHTAFEFTTTLLGAQGTILAGGRYDGLIAQMGGPATPGIGWAAGIERLSMLLAESPAALRPLAVIPMNRATDALCLCQRLRRAGFTADLGYSGNLKKRLARANRVNARAAIILGDEEWDREAVAVRDLDSGIQEEVLLASLEERLAKFR